MRRCALRVQHRGCAGVGMRAAAGGRKVKAYLRRYAMGLDVHLSEREQATHSSVAGSMCIRITSMRRVFVQANQADVRCWLRLYAELPPGAIRLLCFWMMSWDFAAGMPVGCGCDGRPLVFSWWAGW